MQSRIKIDRLTLEFRQKTNSKILIFRNDRKDLPHLTISFGNFSKEIDLHFTTRTASEKNNIDIAKIQEVEIARLLTVITAAFVHYLLNNIRKLKKVRPGWLNRKGYVVYFLDNEAQNKFIDKIVPYKKYHKKFERIFGMIALLRYLHSSEVKDNIFYATVLHDIEKSGCSVPLFVFRARGKHKPTIIPIGLVRGPNGQKIWGRLDKITDGMKEALEPLVSSLFKQILPVDAWLKIYDELHLEDFGIERT